MQTLALSLVSFCKFNLPLIQLILSKSDQCNPLRCVAVFFVSFMYNCILIDAAESIYSEQTSLTIIYRAHIGIIYYTRPFSGLYYRAY